MNRQRIALGAAMLFALTTCDSNGPSGLADELASGTWGGKQAAVMVDGDFAHVHVGCTNGDFPVPVELDEDGRFSVAGDYCSTPTRSRSAPPCRPGSRASCAAASS
jgi:hypothetical protein